MGRSSLYLQGAGKHTECTALSNGGIKDACIFNSNVRTGGLTHQNTAAGSFYVTGKNVID